MMMTMMTLPVKESKNGSIIPNCLIISGVALLSYSPYQRNIGQ